jgi:hypothetical protein
MAEGGEFELLVRFLYLILFSCSDFPRRPPAVDSDGLTCSQPRTCQQSLKNAVSLPWGQSFNFLFAACPDFVPAPCAWLLFVQHQPSSALTNFFWERDAYW